MPLDGCFIHCLAAELQTAVDTHIEKIHIPSKNEFLLTLKGRGCHYRLFFSISPDRPRVNFTTQSFENPEKPPMFCMLLRKYLCGGRITAVETYGCERLLCFTVQATNELGDRVALKLVCELMGHSANLILVGAEGKIIECARHSDLEKGGRLLQPGARYELPQSADKTDLLTGDLTAAAAKIAQSGLPLPNAVLQQVAGVSPLLCRELALRCNAPESPGTAVLPKTIEQQLNALKTAVLNGGTPMLLAEPNGCPKDFTFLAVQQYGSLYRLKQLPGYSELLEAFYGERDRLRRLERFSADLLKTVRNLLSRCERKLALRQKEQNATKNKENLRIQGELLKANLYRVERGATAVTVQNYYSETGEDLTILLNPALSPAQNAAAFFKSYKKACTAEQTLAGLIRSCKAEQSYLQSVLFALQSADDTQTLREIRTELAEAGYLKTAGKGAKKASAPVKPLEFTVDGFKILVGRNNLQNDRLTLKLAQKTDWWFHTKNIHGSHVILCCDGAKPSEKAVLAAAGLAAYYSKARQSGSVPVDYTPQKFVKKPAGAKPGMVIYTTNKTLFVTPALPGEDCESKGD